MYGRKIKWISQLLVVTMVFTMLPLGGLTKASAGAWIGGYDTSWYTQNPSVDSYALSTAEQLAGLSYLVNHGIDFNGKTVTLTNDINLSGSNWTPIGHKDHAIIYGFSGTFNGDGYNITGLSIKSADTIDYIGFFGCINSMATIKNLGIIDADINLSDIFGCGCLTGYCMGTVVDCYATGSVKTTGRCIAGLIGYLWEFNPIIQNCYSDVCVSGKEYVGGLIGSMGNGYAVINCYSCGSVTGVNEVGGLIGYCQGCKIENCCSTAFVSGSSELGGLVGTSNSNHYINCYATAEITGDKAGGFAGCISYNNIKNCYYNNANYKAFGENDVYSVTTALSGLSLGDMKSEAFTQTLNTGLSELSWNDSILQWMYNGGYPELSMLLQPEADIYKGSAEGTIQIAGNVSGNDHFAVKISDNIIKAPVKGIKIEDAVTYISGTDITGADATVNKYIGLYELDADNKAVRYVMFTLTENDIRRENDLAGNGSRLDPFRISSESDLKLFRNSVNNGNSFKDKYLTLMNNIAVSESWTPIGNSDSNKFSGTFDGSGYKISGITIGTSNNAYNGSRAGFFGNAGGCARIMNLGIEININGSGDAMGGIAGSNDGIIINCHVIGTIAANQYIGGIVGSNSGKIIDCYFTGNLSGNQGAVGGIAGSDYNGEIKNCYCLGSISGMLMMGGIVGEACQTRITNCYTTSAIPDSNAGPYSGGLIGMSLSSIISNCYYNSVNATGIGLKGYNDTDPISMSLDQMKELSFVGILNSNSPDLVGAMSWLADKASVNGGYPVLTASKVVTDVTITDAGGTSAIYKGDTLQMSAAVNPKNAEDKNITWSLSDNSLASISEDGLLTAKGVGKVTVTATAVSGISGSYDIYICSGEVTGITLDREALTMSVTGSAITLNANVLPDNARYKEVTWSSSNPGVATVSGGAIATAATGSAIITATTADGGKTASCMVTVVDTLDAIIQSLSVSKATVSIVLDKLPYAGPAAEDFTATCSINGGPAVSLPLSGFAWKEDQKTVTFNFIQIPQTSEKQQVVIKIEYKGDTVAAKAYTINILKVASIAVNSTNGAANVMQGNTLLMNAVVLPVNAGDTSVTWSVINDTGSATISADGVLTAVSPGTVTVKAAANDGSGAFGTKTIIVYAVPSNNSPTQNSSDIANDTLKEDSGKDSNITIDLSKGDYGTADGKVVIPIPLKELEQKLSDKNVSTVAITLQMSETAGNSGKGTGFELSAEVLEAIKESGKNVSITMQGMDHKEHYTWTFDAASMASQNKELSDIDLYMEWKGIEEDAGLKELLGDANADSLIFHFANERVLPAQTSVRIYVGDRKGFIQGEKVYLYHYNQKTGKLETLPFSSGYTVDEDGYITVKLVYCSDYVALLHKADAGSITSLSKQIKVTPTKKTLYVGRTKDNKIQIKLPETLELVNSLKDKTTQSTIGGVTASFSSNNKKVITVDKKGNITAVGTGKAVITTVLKLYNGKTRIVKTTITVKKNKEITKL